VVEKVGGKRANFTIVHQDRSKAPHRFEAFLLSPHSGDIWRRLAEGCLRAWRLDSPTYLAAVKDSGFSSTRIGPLLNSLGAARLPVTPPDDEDVAKSAVVTDATEVLAVLFLDENLPQLVLPWPRVFHKPLPHAGHTGIDLLGYSKSGSASPHSLYVIEVMATNSQSHPPGVVHDHKRQLLDETLADPECMRLLHELTSLHAESDDVHRDVLDEMIIDIELRQLGKKRDVFAVPILVSPTGVFEPRDWSPFHTNTAAFESAPVPSKVTFYALDPNCKLVDIVDRVKAIAENPLSGDKAGS
jgi:hypothetical protein